MLTIIVGLLAKNDTITWLGTLALLGAAFGPLLVNVGFFAFLFGTKRYSDFVDEAEAAEAAAKAEIRDLIEDIKASNPRHHSDKRENRRPVTGNIRRNQ